MEEEGLHLERKTQAAREDCARRRHVHLLRGPGKRDGSKKSFERETVVTKDIFVTKPKR